ncbi:hypothetical protein [Bacillus safensis]|uniref:hypothetical protein n=1 Tax=Bacillus safensis TaxID=561879 RepID=UPI000B44D295|nr:hypothetical protein [Bacillus safensis]MCY7492900.1 hypothetical protein [Bacillus safensis]MED4993220.1 hypothetical protein [Bacillus safensis]UDB49131.1 hypothetical protein B0X07_08515 [Bacillus safensis]
MKKIESKKDFINEFSVINKNKFTLQQTKSLFFGLLYELITERNIFKNKKDLEDFIKEVFKKNYNDYVFRGRPYLASRLIKDISKEYDPSIVSTYIKLILVYLHEKDMNNENNDHRVQRSSKNIEDNVIGWFNTVNKGSKGK